MGQRRFAGGGGGKYVKWNEPGMSISGLIKGFVNEKYKGKDNLQGVMDSDGIERQFPVTVGLLKCFNEAFGRVEDVPNDVRVDIHYQETVKLKDNNTFKRFYLCVDEDAYDLWCKATGFDPDQDDDEARNGVTDPKDTVGY